MGSTWLANATEAVPTFRPAVDIQALKGFFARKSENSQKLQDVL